MAQWWWQQQKQNKNGIEYQHKWHKQRGDWKKTKQQNKTRDKA